MNRLCRTKSDCCGCGACAYVCKSKAITMVEDAEGFRYPEIRLENCVNCGLCEASCPMYVRQQKNDTIPQIYAACHKDEKVRFQSQSGGLFSALSDVVLSCGGVVYGAGFEKDLSVVHQRADSQSARDALRGSKYVQSSMAGVLPLIEKDLSENRQVLFSGTPCQCASIGSLFAKYKKSLFLCDIICHGTPSPKLWRDYLAYKKDKIGCFPEKVIFRNKQEFGWHGCIETVVANKKQYSDMLYTNLFYGCYAMRPSCYSCPFASMERGTDITIGDFWGIEDAALDFQDDNKGISMVLINTEKGAQLFSEASLALTRSVCTTINYDKQPHLKEPVACPSGRELFWHDYQTKGFAYIARKYSCGNAIPRNKSELKPLLIRLGLYKTIKKLLNK